MERYYVVETTQRKELHEMVESMLKEGYEPLGGISTAVNRGNAVYYHQAMYKTDHSERGK